MSVSAGNRFFPSSLGELTLSLHTPNCNSVVIEKKKKIKKANGN